MRIVKMHNDVAMHPTATSGFLCDLSRLQGPASATPAATAICITLSKYTPTRATYRTRARVLSCVRDLEYRAGFDLDHLLSLLVSLAETNVIVSLQTHTILHCAHRPEAPSVELRTQPEANSLISPQVGGDRQTCHCAYCMPFLMWLSR